MRSKSYAKLSLVVLLGTLGLGFSSVAKADMKWFETISKFCPTVCQGTDYKFAVPGGIHSPHPKIVLCLCDRYGRMANRLQHRMGGC
ncbi:MAG: hypothetical protein VSS75_028940 [Candidatus Parabeggiatoa sp.]|nr:hypothetical protein [Candidatus Parabeggiatoa sp.]